MAQQILLSQPFPWPIIIVHLSSIASMNIQRRGPPINMAIVPKIAIPNSASMI